MSDRSLEERTVEVSGIPVHFDDEYLSLYFENKRRSGGGALVSFQRKGSCAVLVFEESEVAERVLSKGSHVANNVTLHVKRKPPADPTKLLLRGISPSTSLELVQLYVENVSDVDCDEYTMYRSPSGDLALIQFKEPRLDFQNVFMKVKKKTLDGASIQAEQVEQTDSILVHNVPRGVCEDLLSLYFESKRGGGAEVKEVVLVKDGTARVSFVDFNAVKGILGKAHKLEQCDLEIQPYFDFLQSEDPPNNDTVEQVHNEGLGQSRNEGLGQSRNEGLGQSRNEGHGLFQNESVVLAHNENEDQTRASPTADLYTAGHPVAAAETTEDERMEVEHSTFSGHVSLPDTLKLSLFTASGILDELQKSHPSYAIDIVDAAMNMTGPSELGIAQLKSQILEFFTSFAEVHVTFDSEKAAFLCREAVKNRIQRDLKHQGLPTVYTVTSCVVTVMSLSLNMVNQASSLIKSLLFDFTISVTKEFECILYSKEWPAFLNSLELCSAKVSEKGDKIEALTIKGMEAENQNRIIQFLSTPVPAEAVITMDPGMMKYIQIHCEQILADMNQVLILPLDAEDISGFRIHGDSNSCQMAEELLRSIMASILTKTITINQPGVARFLTQEGTSILKEMEAKFEVYVSLEKVHWDPLENEDIFESAWKMTSEQNFPRASADGACGSALTRADTDTDGLIEEAKKLVSVIRMDTVSSGPSSLMAHMDLEDVDLYTAAEPSAFQDAEDETQEDATYTVEDASRAQSGGEDSEMGVADLEYATQLSLKTPYGLEEDASLSLAIQYSMDRYRSVEEDEDDELQRALELSRRMAQEEVTGPDSQLDRAIHMSLQDAIRAGNVAEIGVFARYSHDLVRVDIALGKKVGARLCEEKVEDSSLKKLSEHQKKCLDVIRRRHAVEIQIQGTTATFSGFKDYVRDAIADVKKLIGHISGSTSDSEILSTVQWVWHDAQSQPVAYPDKAIIFIENSWRAKQKKIDIVFDNQPYTINFETMQEYSISAGRSVPIARKVVSNEDMAVSDEEYSILSDLPEASKVKEDSDEFQEVVKDFYDTIQEYHNKIKIVQVEKITNSLLLSQYKLKKVSIQQSATAAHVERRLYHGTNETSVKEICIHGFNRSFCGKNATVYGQGVYFAVNSAISVQDQYSPPNADGHKFVFMTKVLTGDFTKGTHEMKTAPLKEASEIPIRFHSVADSVQSPSIFVIFNDTQAYPEYLITCQKIRG